jgi:hypothetical protein
LFTVTGGGGVMAGNKLEILRAIPTEVRLKGLSPDDILGRNR